MSGNLGTLVVKLALELKEYRSKLQEAARDTQQAMGDAGRATEGLDTHTKNLGQSAGATAKQMGDLAQAVAGGDYAGAAQKVGQLATQTTAAGAGVSALTATVGVAVVALAGYAVIAQKASEEQARQANVMALTGNAAGLLTGQMNEMARSVAASTQSAVGSSREIVEGLAATGRVGRGALEEMATAVELVTQASGKSRESVVADFEGMADGVAKWAAKHNESYHFITYEQYQYIKALEDAGRTQEAMQATSEALRRHLERVPDNLGILQRAWRSLGNTASWAWDKMLDLGRAQTTTDKLTGVANQVAYAREKLENAKSKGFSAGVVEKARQELEIALQNQSLLQEQERLERRSADAQAASAKATQDKIAADEQWNRTANTTRNSQQRLAEALADVERNGRLLGKSDQEIRDMQNQVRASMQTRTRATNQLSAAEKEAHDAAMERRKQWLANHNDQQKAAEEEEKWQATLANRRLKAYEEEQKAADAALAAQEKQAESVLARVQRLDDEEKAAALAASQNISLAQAIEQVALARTREIMQQQLAQGADGATLLALQKEIQARERLIGLIGTKEAREANKQAADDAARDWERTWQQVSQSLTDELMRGGKSGKEYIEGIFRTMVLRPVIQWGVQAGMNALGLGGSPQGVGIGSSLSQANNMLPSLGNLGSLLGNSSMGTLDFMGLPLEGFGQALGYVGLAIGAIKLLKSFKSPGEQHTGGFYSSSGATGMDAALGITDGNEAWARDMIKRANPEIEGLVKTTVDSVISATQANAKALGMDIALGIDAGFASNTNGKGKDKNNFGYFDITINGETVAEYMNRTLGTDMTQSVAQWTTDMADAAAQWVLGGEEAWKALAHQGEGASATLDRVVLSLNSVNQMFDMLGHQIELVGIEGATTAAQFADLFGGLQQAQQAVGAYYSEFYSDAERSAYTTRMLSDELDKLGLQMPTTRDQFKGMVDAAIAAGDTELAAKLMAMSGAVASVLPATEAAIVAAERNDEALRQRVDRQKTLWQQQADAADALRGEVQGLFDALAGHITDLRAQALGPVLNARQGQAFIDQALQSALGAGVLPDQVGLETAIAAVRGGLGVGAGQYGNSIEASYAAAKLAGDLETLQGVAGQQLTQAERQYQAAVTQIDQLDQSLDLARDQLDLTQVGIDATLGVKDAIHELTDVLDPSGAKRGGSRGGSSQNYNMGGAGGYMTFADGTSGWVTQDHSGGTYRWDEPSYSPQSHQYLQGLGVYTSTDSQDLFGDLSHLVAAQLQAAFWSPEADQASTLEKWAGEMFYGSTDAALAAVSGLIDQGIIDSYRGLPQLAVGTNYIPQDGAYYLHKGESVQPVAYNPAAGGVGLGGGTQRLEDLLIQMLGRLARLEGVMDLVNTHSKTTADTLARVAPGDAVTFAPAPSIRTS